MSFPGPEKELAKRVEDLIRSDVEVFVTELRPRAARTRGKGRAQRKHEPEPPLCSGAHPEPANCYPSCSSSC